MTQDPKTPSMDHKVIETVDVLDRPSPYEYGGRNEQDAPYCEDGSEVGDD